MSNLVIVEHDNNDVAVATLNAITAAQQIGGDIDLLVAGENCQAVADSAAQIAGVSTVKLVDNAMFGHHMAENLALLIADVAKAIATYWRRPLLLAKTLCPAHRHC